MGINYNGIKDYLLIPILHTPRPCAWILLKREWGMGNWNWKLKIENGKCSRLIVDNADKLFFIFYTQQFLHSAFSTPRIFYTPHFLHPAFSTPRIFYTPHFQHSALRVFHRTVVLILLQFSSFSFVVADVPVIKRDSHLRVKTMYLLGCSQCELHRWRNKMKIDWILGLTCLFHLGAFERFLVLLLSHTLMFISQAWTRASKKRAQLINIFLRVLVIILVIAISGSFISLWKPTNIS